jgi:hypothetical protein
MPEGVYFSLKLIMAGKKILVENNNREMIFSLWSRTKIFQLKMNGTMEPKLFNLFY